MADLSTGRYTGAIGPVFSLSKTARYSSLRTDCAVAERRTDRRQNLPRAKIPKLQHNLRFLALATRQKKSKTLTP